MARKSNVLEAKPKFRPTPQFAALEQEVAKLIERRKALGAEPLTLTGRDPQQITAQIQAIRSRHGLTELTKEESQKLERERAEEDARELRELAARRKEGRWKSLCPEEFREPFDFGKVKKDELGEKGELIPGVKRSVIDKVLDWQFGPRGLYVIGATGRSKTRAVFSMLRREVIEKNRSAIVIDGIAFSTACSTAFRDSANTEKWLRAMKAPDILFIDDIATRFTPATQEGFFGVLDLRTKHRKPVILTTNCTGQMLEDMMASEIRQHLASPLRRRLKEYCEICVV